jgi:hypothetical protein
MGERGEIFSTKSFVQHGQKTYFFNIKENRFGDLFLALVESVRREDSHTFQRNQVVIFEQDWPMFSQLMEQAEKFVLYGKQEWQHILPSSNKSRSYLVKIHMKHKVTTFILQEQKQDDQDLAYAHMIRVDKEDFAAFYSSLKYALRYQAVKKEKAEPLPTSENT